MGTTSGAAELVAAAKAVDGELRDAGQAAESDDSVGVSAVSSIYRTQPVGPADGVAGLTFWNAAATVRATAAPAALLALLHRVEERFGRDRSQLRWTARSLDLDLIAYRDSSGEFVASSAVALRLPHPLAPFRRFVLDPLCELAPNEPMFGMATPADSRSRLRRRPLRIDFGPLEVPRLAGQSGASFESVRDSHDSSADLCIGGDASSALPLETVPKLGNETSAVLLAGLLDEPEVVVDAAAVEAALRS